ncbi:MAG: hypothetical protein WCE63_18015 [Acidobacteriaceae bacterium]
MAKLLGPYRVKHPEQKMFAFGDDDHVGLRAARGNAEASGEGVPSKVKPSATGQR